MSASPSRQSGEEREEGQEEQKDGEETRVEDELDQVFPCEGIGGSGEEGCREEAGAGGRGAWPSEPR